MNRIRIAAGWTLLSLGALGVFGALADPEGGPWLALFSVLLFGLPGFALPFRKAKQHVSYWGLFLIAAGVAIVVGVAYIWSQERAFAGGIEVRAILVESAEESCSSSANRPDTCSWYATYRYSDDGVRHTGRGGVTRGAQKGDTITVVYLPDSPTKSRTTESETSIGGLKFDDSGWDWLILVPIPLGLWIVAWGASFVYHRFNDARDSSG